MNKLFSAGSLFLALFIFASLNACAEPVTQPRVQQVFDLARLARLSRERKLPILLMFSASHCPYCELLENEILNPMLLSGDYHDRVIIAKIVLDDRDDLRNFNGEATDMDSFTTHYNLFVTPTLLFLDANGTEIHHRITGVNTIEMFGGRVDSAIANALKKLRPGRQVAGNLPNKAAGISPAP